MNCKNCQEPLQQAFHFCPNCGARIVNHRINLKRLFRQFTGWFLNLDNALLRTFTGMLYQPEKVISAYIGGVRKKYMSPLSFLTIAITLAGLMIFILQRRFQGRLDFTMGAEEVNPEFSQIWSEIVFDYNAFFFVLYLPILALPAYLFMNRINYNFPEYIVVFIYTLSQWSILTFPFSLAILLISTETYASVNQIASSLVLAFCLYVLQRLNRFGFWSMIGRSLLYLLLTLVLFFMLIGVIMALLFLTGTLDLNSLRPPTA
ncbi:MAG: DUF3667 domain-containing protein [Bacteroidetes bacterium]|nr:MAG: DUF3667 domain-containing protein [Bacteroidota bacterium]